MKSKDKQQWMEKNLRLNKDRELKIGDRVVDCDSYKGVVVKVELLPEGDDHTGTVYVWQEGRYGYGSDNCEHYCLENWHGFLRIIDQN